MPRLSKRERRALREETPVFGYADDYDDEYSAWRRRGYAFVPPPMTLEGKTPPANLTPLPAECMTFHLLRKAKHLSQLDTALRAAGLTLGGFIYTVPVVRTFQFESPGRVATT